MAELKKTDIGYVIDESDTTPGSSAANDVGIYNIKDEFEYFPSDVTNVQDALFDAKAKANLAYSFAQGALAANIKDSVNFVSAEFVAQQSGTNTFNFEANQGALLASNARLIGCVITVFDPWDNTGHSAITATVGFSGQFDTLEASFDLTSGNPQAGGPNFPASGPMVFTGNLIEGLIPTLTITSADDLGEITDGRLRVDLLYVATN